MENRNNLLEALKFIFVIFVCIVHFMQTSAYKIGMIDDTLYRFIYSFHVPAFVFYQVILQMKIRVI